eukprot:gene2055-2242_t
MNLNGWTTTDPQLIADHFAYSLHQRWRRISSQEEEDGKDNGILIFLSTANRRVSVSIGSDVKPEIPSDVMEQFIKNTKRFLEKQQNFPLTVVRLIIDIHMYLSRSCEQLGTKDPFIPPPKNPVILEGPEVTWFGTYMISFIIIVLLLLRINTISATIRQVIGMIVRRLQEV